MSTVVENTSVYRVRVAYSHTLKEGWRVAETTVETTGTDIDHKELAHHAELAYEFGRVEAQRRNHVDKGLVHGG